MIMERGITFPMRSDAMKHFKRVRKLSDLIKNILICVLKMNEGLTSLERHEGE